MGYSLAKAALEAGHEVVMVSGPVNLEYPKEVTVVPVVSTEEMLEAAREQFESCDGLIGVAAPCDYRPVKVSEQKIKKSGEPLVLHLIETPDVVASLGAEKGKRWVVGFALETEDHRFRAITKLEKKSCDLIVLNEPSAMDSATNNVEVLNATGDVVLSASGSKAEVAAEIFRVIDKELVH
jgi:phosphopantothenoylcysteine decarboxylase/phosphopantothenate--cysteine ligase